jgi:mannose/fructose/N-acetylgalactosamine-specific phosphotransferase system component IIC
MVLIFLSACSCSAAMITFQSHGFNALLVGHGVVLILGHLTTAEETKGI